MTDYFFHDWSVNSQIETSWETDVVQAGSTLAECRRQILNSPIRTVEVSILPFDEARTIRALMALIRMASDHLSIPLYSDVAAVTSDSNGTTLSIVTAFKRFYAGRNVVVLPWDGGEFGDPQVQTINAVNANDLDLTAALTGTVPAGSLVFPLISAHMLSEPSLTLTTDRVGRLNFSALERVEDGTTLPEAHDTTVVAGFQTGLSGLPIFDLHANWREDVVISYARGGDTIRFGRASLRQPTAARGRWSQRFTLTFTEREDFWDLLQFFDSRRGRLLPFWVPSQMPFWDLTAINSVTELDVTENFDLADFSEGVSHVALVMNDGTIYVRAADSIASLGTGQARITLATALPALSLADVDYLGLAVLSRFDSDALTEVWLNDEVCEVPISLVEVLEEDDDEVLNVQYVPGVEASAC